jgi:hypothetical protein
LIKYFTPLSRWMINIRGLSRKRSVRWEERRSGRKGQKDIVQTRRKWKRPSDSVDGMAGWTTRKRSTLSCSNSSVSQIPQDYWVDDSSILNHFSLICRLTCR